MQKVESVWAFHEMYPVVDMVRDKFNDVQTHMRAMAMSSVSLTTNANLLRMAEIKASIVSEDILIFDEGTRSTAWM